MNTRGKIEITLKSGAKVEFEARNFEVTTSRQTGDLLEWSCSDYGKMKPLYIRPDDVSAILAEPTK